nr:MAG TPA: hypothetical protein [Caudoviricetes sp.]
MHLRCILRCILSKTYLFSHFNHNYVKRYTADK